MHPFKERAPVLTALALLIFSSFVWVPLPAQQITGVWKGKIDRKKVEIKIIQKGDSLTGTSYYYESAHNYRRYSIKGYFSQDNSAVWWDDQLIEEKSAGIGGAPGKTPLFSVADFNCPGSGEMYLHGKATPKENSDETDRPVDLTKVTTPGFDDEWDFVIDNYTVGTNDPYIIDSVSLIAAAPVATKKEGTMVREKPQEPTTATRNPNRVMIPAPPQPSPRVITQTALPLTIEEKFTSRKKVVTTEIPVEGDSIELRFYDNAEVDGDSISLFLNDGLLFKHIRLTDKAYAIKLPVSELKAENELTMVAENLGSIPPNTAYMVALVGNKRYEAKLASTEGSSAVIRLIRVAEKKAAVMPGGY